MSPTPSRWLPVLAVALACSAGPARAQALPDTLAVAVLDDWAPHYLVDDQGRPSGFAVEVARAVAQRIDLPVRFVTFRSFPEAIDALRDGTVDVIPDFGVIPSRESDFSFTRPFEAFHVSLFLRSSAPTADASQDLAGRRIGVVRTNVGVELVPERYPRAEMVDFNNVREALFELLAAGVDAVVYPQEVFLALARQARVDDRVVPAEPPLVEVNRAMGVRAGDTALLAALDRGVDALVGTPEYVAIYQRWFGQERPFWTASRVGWMSGVLLLLVLVGMAVWRYRSVSKLVRNLTQTLRERDAAREASRLEEERFRTVVETSYEGIVLADSENRISFVNGRACELVSASEPEELLGESIFTYVDPEYRGRMQEGIARRREGISESYEVLLRTLDGEVRWVLLSVAPIHGVDGSFTGSVATLADITDRVRAEEQLRQSQKMEAVGRLAGGIAHDFNNLLTVVRSETDLLLLELGDDDPMVEDLAVIRRAADRAATLTSQLLAFSRDQVLQPRVVELCGVIQDMAELLERVIGDDIHVVVDVPSGLPPVRVDPTGLEQAVLNMAINARDAMPEGGTFTLATSQEMLEAEDTDGEDLPAGPYTVLSVSDTGAGMEPEVLARAFEPFFTTKDRKGGTGLGLAMTYGFVKQSGGSIQVESEPGEGTTFVMRFPAVNEDPEEIPGDPGSATRSGPVAGTVLLVEDDDSVRAVAEKVLRRSGFRVLAAETAEKGLGMLEENEEIALIVTDLVLPGMSGRELVERVRASASPTPVLVMSGYADGSPGHPGELDPDIPFIQKPFTPEGLVAAVQNAMAGEG